jgi:hypothetical protein
MRHDKIICEYAQRLGMGYLYEQWQMANVKADKVKIRYPLLVYVMPATGRLQIKQAEAVTDQPLALFAFLAPVPRHDYDSKDGAPIIEAMKAKMLEFIHLVNTSGDYEPINGEVSYNVVFHKLDRDLMGVSFDARLVPVIPECLSDYGND